MNWWKNIKHIVTVKHVENLKIFHVDLNLDSFSDTTIVAEPLPEDMDPHIKTDILTKRKEILSLVKQK